MEYLQKPGTKADWKEISKWLLKDLPDWASPVPFQVKKIAIRDACFAVRKAKQDFTKTGKINKVHFRSRRDPQQSCFIPKSAVKLDGLYHTISGKGLRYSEQLPGEIADSRLILRNGRWYLSVPIKSTTQIPENQGRVVALDPGIRSFITFFAEDSCGHLGQGDFGRIQRLATHLDNLLSKLDRGRKDDNVGAKRRYRMRKAAARLRQKIMDLIDELHWKVARFLVDSFDIILLPTFETKQMASKAGRKLRKKSVRSMLTFAHYRFKERLKQKAFETGKVVYDVNEAYTSKTASWSGEIVKNLGGAKSIKSGGIEVDRDINGARGIFLRALRDTSSLRNSRSEQWLAFVN